MSLHPYEVARKETTPLATVHQALFRRLPPRYATEVWDRPLRKRLDSVLAPGVQLLDVGAGAKPTLPPDQRPEGTRYVGLDVDGDELARAPAGSYDEIVVGSAETRLASLERRFDIVISFLALEHVRSTASVFDNVRAYLRPGGLFVAQLAGAFSLSALVNRLVPHRAAPGLLRRTQGRDPHTVFPARYDQCSATALNELLGAGWAEHEVIPLFTGAGYVLFARPLTALYIAYEEWAYRRRRSNLATYYLVVARVDSREGSA